MVLMGRGCAIVKSLRVLESDMGSEFFASLSFHFFKSVEREQMISFHILLWQLRDVCELFTIPTITIPTISTTLNNIYHLCFVPATGLWLNRTSYLLNKLLCFRKDLQCKAGTYMLHTAGI